MFQTFLTQILFPCIHVSIAQCFLNHAKTKVQKGVKIYYGYFSIQVLCLRHSKTAFATLQHILQKSYLLHEIYRGAPSHKQLVVVYFIANSFIISEFAQNGSGFPIFSCNIVTTSETLTLTKLHKHHSSLEPAIIYLSGELGL